MLDRLGDYVDEKIRFSGTGLRPTYTKWIKASFFVGVGCTAVLIGTLLHNFLVKGTLEIEVCLPPLIVQSFHLPEKAIVTPTVAIAIALVAMFPFLFMFTFPIVRCEDRRSGVEVEFPFASSLFTLLIESGVPLMKVFEMLGRGDGSPFPYFSKECERILWSSMMMEIFAGIRDVVFSNPSRTFRDYFYGFLSVMDSGGDVVGYLGERSRVTLKVWSSKLREMGSRVRLLMEGYLASACSIVLMGYVMLMLFAQMAKLFPALGTQASSEVLAYIPVPVALVFLLVSQVIQVRFPTVRGEPYKEAAVCLLISWAVSYALFAYFNLAPQDVLGIAVISGLIYPTYLHERDARRVRNIENQLPDFLGVLVENRRMGLGPEKSVNLTYESLKGGLSNELRKRLPTLELGVSLADIFRDIGECVKSWFVHGFMLLLSYSVEYGGAEVGMLEKISEFARDYHAIKKEHEAEISMYRYIPYGVLSMTFFTIVAFSFEAPPENLVLSMVLFAVLNGIVSGKVVGGSLADGFKHVIVMVVIALIVVDFILGRAPLIKLPMMV